MDIKNKYLAYFSTKTGSIISLEKIYELDGFDKNSSLAFFKTVNNIEDEIDLEFFDFEEYDKLYEPDFINLFYIDVNKRKLKVSYSYKKSFVSSSRYLWSNMDPQRPYTEEQVKEMYEQDYINCNLKNVLAHKDKFFQYEFVPLDQLVLREDVMSKNWDTYFKDPYLLDSASDKTKLAKSIMENGTYYPIQVVTNGDCETYTVREGNHRIASLKIGQAYGIVPEDYKILCVIMTPVMFSASVKTLQGVLTTPVIGRYNIDPVWTSKNVTDEFYRNKIKESVEFNNEKFINEYTVETQKDTIYDAYKFLYIYPLFLRDLLYKYPNIKPSKVINDEKLFNEWIKQE